MSLQVWLPLTSDLRNQGLSTTTFSGTPAWKTYGKLANSSLNLQNRITCSTPSLNGVQFFSVAFWGRIEANSDSTANWMDVIGFTDISTGGSSGQFRFETGYGNTAYGGIHWHDNATNAIINGSYTYNTASEYDNWHHIVVTVSDTAVKSYYDGQLKQTHTTNLNKGYLNGNWWLGESTTRGCIQDVRIYDHALSDKEVEEIAKGLVLHYKLDASINATLSPNLLLNSAPHLNALTSWSSAGNGWTNSLVEDSTAPYGHAVRCTYSGTTQTAGGTHHPTSVDKTTLTTGDIYTLSGWIRASKNCICNFYNELMTTTKQVNVTTQWQYFTHTSAIDTGKTYQSNVFYCRASDAEQNMWVEVKMLKLEKGSVATPWCPHISDTIYNAYYNNTIYDSSGYSNDGIITGDIQIDGNTARYSCSMKQTNGQYIRVEKRPAECLPKDKMTVNFWMYCTTWGNPVSCTEGGGWNFENGSTGIRFPVYISGVGYKYQDTTVTTSSLLNAWHMLTGVFDGSNVLTYIDGELKTSVSTGSTNGIGYANNYLFIGAEASGNSTSPASSSYAGNLSDFRIYATALTAAQILELYHTSASIDNDGNIYTRELVEE